MTNITNMSSTPSTIESILRGIRSRLNLTQERLAERLGVSVATVNRWEGGATTPQKAARKVILALAEEAGVDPQGAERPQGPAGVIRRRRSTKGAASPYATGGGGVTLERLYGATLLTALLLRDPVPGLPDGVSANAVQFQAGESSPVDDYVVWGGEAPDSSPGAMRLSVAVRRAPSIAPGDTKFVKLLGDYLQIMVEAPNDVASGRWRFGLVVAGPHAGAADTSWLADAARVHASNKSFREGVGRPAATTAGVRQRLGHLDGAVQEAAKSHKAQLGDLEEATWRLLRSLYVMQPRLEGDDAADRTNAVARLRSLFGSAADADNAFRRLCELAGTFATRGGVVDRETLRRELTSGLAVPRDPTLQMAWSVLATCEEQLRVRTSSTLTEASTGRTLSLPRHDEVGRLAQAMKTAGHAAGRFIVTGEPDVGKSALTLAAADILRREGMSVVALNLRDLPRSPAEFEGLLGTNTVHVLGGTQVALSRIILVDGAEAVLEGRNDLLAHLARAAARAGLGMVAVTRDDAGAEVRRALTIAGGAEATEFAIQPLTTPDVDDLVGCFPALNRVAQEPRARWLLGRLGLVAILLQSGAHAALPDGALSEADVFAAVWSQLVRRNNNVVPGEATPDGREATLLEIARKQLGVHAITTVTDPLALPSLRSDRLLLPLGPTAAWKRGDEFANDLIRDFATARLLIVSLPDDVVASAGAPRWTVRAARLACQAALLDAGDDIEAVRSARQLSFDALAKVHGERWSDLVWEAVLTLGAAGDALKAAAPTLFQGKGRPLENLLRVVRQRFIRGHLADTVLVEPVVELLCDRKDALAHLPERLQEKADEIVETWLASLAVRGKADASHPLRCRVRDEILRYEADDNPGLGGIGLLGPDLDAAAEKILREVASRDPESLHPLLENSFAPISLAAHRSDLLLDLTEAYYIEHRDPHDPRGYPGMDDGIRDHRLGGGMSPLAAAHYGPFWSLLASRPRESIALINRILNHAVRYRVARNGADPESLPTAELPGITVAWPSGGVRHFAGDDQAWRWYRGTGVGPYPCMSALFAVEHLVDQIMRAVDVRLDKIVTLLLADCENLAMPALIVGTLVRSADRVIDELDPWLANPVVWRFEFDRALTSQLPPLLVRANDGEDVRGRSRRSWSLREVAGYLVSRALLGDDQAALARLSAVGDELLARATAMEVAQVDGAVPSTWEGVAASGRSEARDWVLTVRGWASSLQSAHYHTRPAEDGRMAICYDPPTEVVEAFSVERKDSERGMESYRLLNTYSKGDPSTWSHTLAADLRLARELEADPPNAGPPEPMRAPVAVAAAAVECHVAGGLGLPEGDVLWAVDAIVRAASQADELTSENAVFPWGTDRLAARALPRILTVAEDALGETRGAAVLNALYQCARSTSDEVRRVLGAATTPLWDAPCSRSGSGCVHKEALDAFRNSARFCTFNGVDPATGQPRVVSLGPDVEADLATVHADRVLLSRLVGPILVATSCARSRSCVAEEASRLRDALLEAHGRASVHYAKGNYRRSDDDDRAVAGALLDIGQEAVVQHVKQYTACANALGGLLRDLAAAATADASRRRTLRAAWPAVMDAAMDAIDAGQDYRQDRYGGARAFGAIVPRPMPTGREADVEAALRSASEGWPLIGELGSRVDRWLGMAPAGSECVDALVGLLDTAPLDDQVHRGLPWVATLVARGVRAIANHSYLLPGWLESIRGSRRLTGEVKALYQRVIDSLAAAGDARAVRLQGMLEA